MHTGGGTWGTGRAEQGELGSPAVQSQLPLQCLGGSGLSSVQQEKQEATVCTKRPWSPADVVALGLQHHQTFTSLPNLAEEMVLMTTISPHPCGTARAGSVLTAGREQGAKYLSQVSSHHRGEL